jgi:hypothetical protein
LLFLHSVLGITNFVTPIRGWLIGAFILSGAILLTHIGTLISERWTRRRIVDLRLVPGNPIHCRWGIGALGDTPTMSVSVAMNFAHNEKDLSVSIKRAYLKGTREAARLVPEVVVDGPNCGEELLHMFLLPITAKPGKKLIGRVVFVDQFNCKHVTGRITFAPMSLPVASRGNQPTCFFCHKPVGPSELVQEAAMSAHKSCVWR